MKKILVLPGDGIGSEIMDEAVKVLDCVNDICRLSITIDEGLVGGAAIDATGSPLPPETLNKARETDAILLGAVGGPRWDHLKSPNRPENGLLGLRSELDLFANMRPAISHSRLVSASSLKPELVSGLDILIVRELVGGIYFGTPRGIRKLDNGEREGFNTYIYKESEIERIGHLAFEAARTRNGKLCSVDKANVLEVTALWREVMEKLSDNYPDVELTHMYVDNAAMQLVRKPKQFDVIVTGNMFGDILSDCAAMLTGSIGMLPSASLDKNNKGMYEPVHGSAPDIAGKQQANPIATILSLSMLLRYSLKAINAADMIDLAVQKVLDSGLRTDDIWSDGCTRSSTREMGDAITKALVSLRVG